MMMQRSNPLLPLGNLNSKLTRRLGLLNRRLLLICDGRHRARSRRRRRRLR